MKKTIAIIVAIYLIFGSLVYISFQLSNIYDTLKYDFRPESRIVNNIDLDCPVEKGAILVINEGESK
jgi:hypothetical protein